MLDPFRWYEREVLSTFIVGNRYVSVYSLYKTFDVVVEAVLEHIGDGQLKKPFVLLNAGEMRGNLQQVLIDNELLDIVLE